MLQDKNNSSTNSFYGSIEEIMQSVLSLLDQFLGSFTMYRLLLYFLRILLVLATILSWIGILPYNGWDILISGLYLITLCWVGNQLFARLFKVKPNYESQYITGSILALIVGPLPLLPNIIFLTLLPFLAMGSKYLLVFKKQHIFNPAAFAVVATAVVMGQGASWWVGDRTLLPFIVVGGLILVQKMRRFHLILSFLGTYALLTLFVSLIRYNIPLSDAPIILGSSLLSPSLLFFSFVMLTEPITSPADRKMRMYFGITTAIIFILFQNTLQIFYSLELSLISANLLGRFLHFPGKYQLILKEKKRIGDHIWQFLFESAPKIQYKAGQFLEWTLSHKNPDSRGNRRYFTIASSPTEQDIMLTVKIPEKTSSFKKALQDLQIGETLLATNLEGQFTLLKDVSSYVFIAGGIGITPFRSMIQYMLDKKITTPVTLFYLVHTTKEIVFDDILKKAEKELGLQLVYIVSKDPSWKGEKGHLTDKMIKKYVTDYHSSYFYLSGPQPMVAAYKQLLRDLSIPKRQIKTDYFPGYTETYTKENK